jgi:hypothetical protein
MASPVSISEIFFGIQILRRIVESFVDPYNKAPEQILLLISTSRDLHSMLTESEDLLRSCNRAYPGQRNFLRRLEETDAFIKRYQILAAETQSKRKKPMKAIMTVAHSFEDDKARSIHAGLQFEMQKLIQFLLLLGL